MEDYYICTSITGRKRVEPEAAKIIYNKLKEIDIRNLEQTLFGFKFSYNGDLVELLQNLGTLPEGFHMYGPLRQITNLKSNKNNYELTIMVS